MTIDPLRRIFVRAESPYRIALVGFGTISIGMVLLTWGTWADPLVDFGRDVYVAWRIAEGDTLYRDVEYFNGPLSPHVNALVFRILGRSPSSLYFSNYVIQFMISFVSYNLARSISNPRTGFFVAITFQLGFVYTNYAIISNYNYIAPYSHEITHGLALGLWGLMAIDRWMNERRLINAIVSGILAGLAFLTKPEPFFAVIASLTVASMIVAIRYSAWESLKGLGLFWLSVASVILISAISISSSIPFQDVIMIYARNWTYVFNTRISSLPFYLSCIGLDKPLHHLCGISFWFLLQTYLIRLFIRTSSSSSFIDSSSVDSVLLAVSILVLAVHPGSVNPAFCFSSLPVWLVVILVKYFRIVLISGKKADFEIACRTISFSIFALIFLSKIILNARITHYGFALAWPAVAVILAVIGRKSIEIRERGGNFLRFELMVFIASVSTFAFSWSNFERLNLARTSLIHTDGIPAIRTFPARAETVNRAIGLVHRHVGQNETLAVWPQGAMVNFWTKRVNSVPYVVLMPPEVIMFGEDVILEAYRDRAPDYVLEFDMNLSEYGFERLGHGYGESLIGWLESNFVTVESVTSPVVPMGADQQIPFGHGMRLMKRRKSVDQE